MPRGCPSSIRAGIAAVPEAVDGALIVLGDMPEVDAALIDRLIEAFDPARGALVVVPSREGRRGNPVLWARRFFADLARLEGDQRRPPSDRCPRRRAWRRWRWTARGPFATSTRLQALDAARTVLQVGTRGVRPHRGRRRYSEIAIDQPARTAARSATVRLGGGIGPSSSARRSKRAPISWSRRRGGGTPRRSSLGVRSSFASRFCFDLQPRTRFSGVT